MKFLKQLYTSNLFKISFYNALSLFVKLITGLISSKAIALFLGPSGLVLMANLRNFISISENIGLMGLQNAIVIEIAKNKNNKEKLDSILQTFILFFLFCSLLISLTIILFYNYIANQLFLNDYKYIIFWAAFFIPFQVIYIFLLQVLNGLQEFKKLYLTHIFSNIFYVILSVVLLWKFGIIGGLLSIIMAPLLFFITVLLNYPFPKINLVQFKKFDFLWIKSLLPITIMILFTTIFSQLTTLEIRKHIVSICGVDEAGYWEAMQRISSIYMLFFTSLISIYYLPKLTEVLINKNKTVEYNTIIRNFYFKLIPLIVLTLILVFLLKLIIIKIVLNLAFIKVEHFFIGQLVGDFFKISSSIFALQFFIRKEAKTYIIMESISLILYLLLSFYFIKIYQGVGATYSFAISNMVYFMLVVVYRLYLKSLIQKK